MEINEKSLDKIRIKFQEFAKASEDIKKVIAAISEFTGGLDKCKSNADSLDKAASFPNLSALKNLMENEILPVISALSSAIIGVAAVFTIITGPIGLTAAAIVALGVSIAILLNNLDTAKYVIATVVSGIKITFLQMVQSVFGAFSSLLGKIPGMGGMFKNQLSEIALAIENESNESSRRTMDYKIAMWQKEKQGNEKKKKETQDTIEAEQGYYKALLDYQINAGEKTLEDKKAFLKQELSSVKTNTLKEIELKQALLDVEKQINEDAKKDIDARLAYEKAQFDDFSIKQKKDTLTLERQQIEERLAIAKEGNAEYYALKRQQYENEKELNELGNYEFVGGWTLAFEEIQNNAENWKEIFMGIFNEAVGAISMQIQNLVDGSIDTWGKFGMAITNIWRTLKDAVIKALADMLAKEIATWAVEKTIVGAKALWNVITGATDALAKDPNPYTKIVTAIAVLAAGIAIIAKGAGAFAQGGVVGGASWSGDNIIARVNSGEMILNDAQQSNLWRIANGQNNGISDGASATINQNIEINAGGDISSLTQAIRRGTLEALEFAGLTYNVGAKQKGVAI